MTRALTRAMTRALTRAMTRAMTSTRVQAWLPHRTTCRRGLGCLRVSVGTTVLSAVILVALVTGAGVPAGTANVIAVCCGILPSYLANPRWTRGRPGKGSGAREVWPFWALSLAGLIVSVAQFVVLDRVIFHPMRELDHR